MARAEPPKPAAPPAPAPAPLTATPKPGAAPAIPATAAKPAASPPAAKPAAAAPAGSGMSESKYLSVLYAEIAKHTPENNLAGPGEVTASFIVGASGRVDKVTIDKTSSPAHAEIVKKILAEVVTPPPPGGPMDVGQTFKFR
ncbi:energy transducer TonB [Methylocystis parvus]|uniref:Energy transducer TonB n=2 Tax=Methylocystis parvus TaxID=134 RepID=A0A6B8M3L3_9HYPH|nr:energy transducer TonB [Methylocystis parvus]